MKFKLLTTTLIIILFSAFTNKSENKQGIEFFEGSWKEALKKAKSENKYIFLDAYATWCGPCKQMSNSVFPEEQLGKLYNEHFINVKMDMESREGKEVMKKFPIKGYPTLIYIDPSGKEVRRLNGVQNAEKLISVAKQVLKME